VNRGHPIRAACKRAARPARREMTSSCQDLFFFFFPHRCGYVGKRRSLSAWRFEACRVASELAPPAFRSMGASKATPTLIGALARGGVCPTATGDQRSPSSIAHNTRHTYQAASSKPSKNVGPGRGRT